MVPERGRIRPGRLKDRFGEQLRKRRDRLSPSLLAVADYIDGHRHAVLGLSALEIGFETGTSDATVIRAIQALGFGGLVDLRETLEAWLGETDSAVEKMATTVAAAAGDSGEHAVDFIVESLTRTLEALDGSANRDAMRQATSLIAEARGVGFFGIGASGIVATYAARLFDRVGMPSYALNRTGIDLAEQLLSMRPGHVLVMMLHGRPHREALATIGEAERLGVPIILLLSNPDSPLRERASACLTLPRARGEQVALHAPSLIAMETLFLAVSLAMPAESLESLERLIALRTEIRPHSR